MSRFTSLHYTIDDSPPWSTTIVLGLQQYLVLLSAALPTPAIIASIICAQHNDVLTSELLGNILIAAGLATLVQDTLGSRLPIIQSPSYSFIVPMLALIQVEDWKCPTIPDDPNPGNGTNNGTILTEESISRMQMLSGTIMVAATVEVFIGLTGLVGLLLRLVGPLTVAPTLILIALSLTEYAADRAGGHWAISIATAIVDGSESTHGHYAINGNFARTIILIIILSECLPVFHVQLPSLKKDSSEKKKTSIIFHKIFSVIISVCFMWLVCHILTITDTLPSDPNAYGYHARTDIRAKAIQDAKWFRVPYPGEWGMPSFNSAMFVGLFVGVFISIIESIGDYYACGRLSGAPPPPPHAINRGIMCEGFGCIISGILSTGSGVTSGSQNIGAMSLTKVGSRRVGQMAGLMLILFGSFGKFSALIISMPDPIIGSSFIVLFGIIAAIGASNLQYANLNSSRNILVIGLSLFLGLCVPGWTVQNADRLKTGNVSLDHVISVLLGTSMFVGCVVGLLLDNLLPGTPEERGIAAWKVEIHFDDVQDSDKQLIIEEQKRAYDLSFCDSLVRSLWWTKYLPICHNFRQTEGTCRREVSTTHVGESSSPPLVDKEGNVVLIYGVVREQITDEDQITTKM